MTDNVSVTKKHTCHLKDYITVRGYGEQLVWNAKKMEV